MSASSTKATMIRLAVLLVLGGAAVIAAVVYKTQGQSDLETRMLDAAVLEMEDLHRDAQQTRYLQDLVRTYHSEAMEEVHDKRVVGRGSFSEPRYFTLLYQKVVDHAERDGLTDAALALVAHAQENGLDVRFSKIPGR